ncbi:Uncharacterised protein [uncultured archaeon]|nr:Uncharacterised protein [uncultured archaeon]
MSHELIEMDEMLILIGFVLIIFKAWTVGIGLIVFGVILHFLIHASHGGEAHH